MCGSVCSWTHLEVDELLELLGRPAPAHVRALAQRARPGARRVHQHCPAHTLISDAQCWVPWVQNAICQEANTMPLFGHASVEECLAVEWSVVDAANDSPDHMWLHHAATMYNI